VSNPYEDENTGNAYSDQGPWICYGVVQEPRGWAQNHEYEAPEGGEDPTVAKIPRPAYEEAIPHNDARIRTTCVDDA
jgi:hypothetical protein